MSNVNQESAIFGPISLLKNYNFESTHDSYEKVLKMWLERFSLSWINLALIESLYQGRYKVVSVEQILTLWQRRGKPSYHFNHEFARMVSNNLPQRLSERPIPNSKKSARSRWSSHSYKSGPAAGATNPPKALEESKERDSVLFINPSIGSKSLQAESLYLEENVNAFSELLSSESSPLAGSEGLTHEPKTEGNADTLRLFDFEALTQDASQESDFDDSQILSGDPSLTLSEPLDDFLQTEQNSELLPQDASETSERIEDSQVFSDEKGAVDLGDESIEANSEESSTTVLSQSLISTDPIHQFVPQTETSDFYSKLTAMAQNHG